MRPRKFTMLTISLLGTGALLAGCGANEPEQDEQPAESADSTGAANSTEMTEAAQLKTAESDVGTLLVDGEGMSLYLFTQDEQGASTCFDDCLANWPALEGELTAGDGVDESMVGAIERDDGTMQTTYNDWPLYYFAQDEAAGDLKGQGVNEVWYVVSPDGEAITEVPAPASGGSRGY